MKWFFVRKSNGLFYFFVGILLCTALDELEWEIYMKPIAEWIFDSFHLNCTRHFNSMHILQHFKHFKKSRRVSRLMMVKIKKKLVCLQVKAHHQVYTQNFSTFAESQIIYSCMSAHHSFTQFAGFFFACSSLFLVYSPDRSRYICK